MKKRLTAVVSAVFGFLLLFAASGCSDEISTFTDAAPLLNRQRQADEAYAAYRLDFENFCR